MSEQKKTVLNALALDWNNVSSYDYSESENANSPKFSLDLQNVLQLVFSNERLSEDQKDTQNLAENNFN